MLVYYIFPGLALILSIASGRIAKFPKRLLPFLLIAFPLCVLSAIRSYTVGSDTAMYALNWALPEITNSSWPEIIDNGRWEIGFALICKLCALTPNPPRSLLIVTSVIIFGCAAYAVSRVSENPALSWLLLILSGLFYFDMQLMRQAIAIAIIQVGIIALLKHRNILFLISVVLATTFHKSALVVTLLLITIYCVGRRSWRVLLALFFMFLAIILVTPLSLFNQLLSSIGYDNYADSIQYNTSGNLVPTLYILIFLSFLLAFWIAKKYTFDSLNMSRTDIIYLGTLLCGLLFSCASFKSAIIYRTIFYFIGILTLIAPSYTFSKVRMSSNALSLSLFYGPFIVLFILYTFIVPDWSMVFPYEIS
jgi:hypothetical protein